jgi:hypothetical protein
MPQELGHAAFLHQDVAPGAQVALALLGEVVDGELGALTVVLLQQSETGAGRTDVSGRARRRVERLVTYTKAAVGQDRRRAVKRGRKR